MLTIDALQLQLPPGFEHRAERIARLVAEALGALAPRDSATLDDVVLPPLAFAPHAGDADIAAGIAGALQAQLAAPAGGER